MLTAAELLRSLTALSLHFPQGGRSPQELQGLAQDWLEDLRMFSPQELEQAVKMARRELDFFPSTKQMIEFCARARGELRRWQARTALPAMREDMEANAERGIRHCREILARLERRRGSAQPA